MRIEFLTQEDPIYVLPLFEELFRRYSDEFDFVRVSSCRTMGSRPRLQLARELVTLYGAGGFSRLLARAAVARICGLLSLRKHAKKYFSLHQLCKSHGIEFRSIGNPNAPAFVGEVQHRECDLIISVACPYLLKKRILSVPPLGCINIHHAPLPRYKGMMPTFWQLYHGEKTVGLTVHYMGEKLDEGDALLQEELTVEKGESLDHLIRRSKRHGAHCLAKVLRSMSDNSITTLPMEHEKGSYFTFPTTAEIREFQRRGLRAI